MLVTKLPVSRFQVVHWVSILSPGHWRLEVIVWLDFLCGGRNGEHLYDFFFFFLVFMEEGIDGVQSVCACPSLSILGLTANCHEYPSLLYSPRVIMTVSKCHPPHFQIIPEVDCIVLVDRPDSEKVLSAELLNKNLPVTHRCVKAYLLGLTD